MGYIKLRLQVVSDLHLESGHWPEIINNGSDVLILSGDICVAKDIDKFIPFFVDVCSRWRNVIYLMGNHEHYGGDFNTTLEILKKTLDNLDELENLHILENDYCIIGDTYFYGATLWTDCNDNDPSTKHTLARGLNDYRIVKGEYDRLTPDETYKVHKDTLANLDEFIHVNKPDKLVVCTHHAPSYQSIDMVRYGGDRQMNGGYASSLESFIIEHTEIKLWTHGHVHHSGEYNIDDTKVIYNPAGYPQRGRDNLIYRENINFQPTKIIEV